MRRIALVAHLIWVMPALAQSPNTQHLVFPDLATCQARSAAMCAQMGCQTGTSFWWSCEKLMDGTAAVQIENWRPDFTATPRPGKGLTTAEQAALKDRATVGTNLPMIVPAAAILAKLSIAKQNAITTFASTHPAVKTVWDAINAGTPVDLGNPKIYDFISAILTAGRINGADAEALATPRTPP